MSAVAPLSQEATPAGVAARHLQPVPAVLSLRELLRVSKDRSKRQKSQGQQHHDHETALAYSTTMVLSDLPAYLETGSASPYRRKVRVDFEQLVEDIRTGAFGADGLLLWEPSRGSREVEEWVPFLKLLAQRRIVVVVFTMGMRVLQPWVHWDWKTLMDAAVSSEMESRLISERVGRDMADAARNGAVPGGRRAYGYTATRGQIVEREAVVIQEMARRVLAGESVRAITASLNDRGIRTSTGKVWHPGAVTQLLRSPRIAGLRTHQGVVVAEGQWKPIIDRDTWRRVSAALASRSPVGRRGRTPWLLTGLLVCGRCGAPLVGQTDTRGTRRYSCRQGPGQRGTCGGLVIKAEPTEELLAAALVKRLEDGDGLGEPEEEDSAEQAELDRIEAKRLEHRELFNDGLQPREDYVLAIQDLDRRRKAVEAQLAAKVKRVAPVDLLDGRPWDELELERQRAVLETAYERVVIQPSSLRGSTRFEPQRLQPEWRA